MGKYNSYTAEFKVKVINFTEQNRNFPVEWEFSINKAHIYYWRSKKKRCAKRKDVRIFQNPKMETFLSLNKNYLNTLREHGTREMLYLTKCYSYERVRQQDR
jgi:hypothetical protein